MNNIKNKICLLFDTQNLMNFYLIPNLTKLLKINSYFNIKSYVIWFYKL